MTGSWREIGKAGTAAVLLWTLAACGAAEWPPRSETTATAPRAQPQSQAPLRAVEGVEARRRDGGDLTFVGASAVRVGPGDTLYAISRRHRVGLRPLIEANGLEPPFILQVNQRLVLPRGRQHTVSAGETVYAIAQKYDVEPNELARINGIRPPYTIRVGEDLLIPTGTLQSVKAPHRPEPDPAAPQAATPQAQRQRLLLASLRGAGDFALRGQAERPAQRRHQHQSAPGHARGGHGKRRCRLCGE